MQSQKVVVMGVMRSGTTLLANYLNAHSNITIKRDIFNSLFASCPKLGIKKLNEPINSQQKKNMLLTCLKADEQLFGSNFLDVITPNSFSNLGELLNLSLNLLISTKKDIIGFKLTNNTSYLGQLLEQPNFKLIYIIRDLRDVILSSANYFTWYNLYSCAKTWKDAIKTVLSLHPHPHLHLLHYEDLIQEKEKEVKRLSHFLGIKLLWRMNSLKDLENEEWISNTSFHDIKKSFDPTAVFRWKKQNGREVNYATWRYGKLLRTIGYTNQIFPFPQRLKFRFLHTKYSFRHNLREGGKTLFDKFL